MFASTCLSADFDVVYVYFSHFVVVLSTKVDMEKDEEFLHGYFTYVSQMCYDKAKEHVEKEKEICRTTNNQSVAWCMLLAQLHQLALAEKSYMEIGFLQNKNKGFLRKDNSLRAVYENIRFEIRRIEELVNKQAPHDKRLSGHCNNFNEFVSTRMNLIDFYDKIFLTSTNKMFKYNDLLQSIESLILKDTQNFTGLSLTPIKAVVSLECSVMEQLFKALMELQRLQFLPSLALIHGAHTRLAAWENQLQNRETWKLGFLKNSQLPALFQWHSKLKGAILSKFSLFFHDTLASQTTQNDMRQQCSKLQYDYYYKMANFQKKYDAVSLFFLSDNQVSCDTTDYDSFPVIVSCPPRPPPHLDVIMKLILESSSELSPDKITYKYSLQEKHMFMYTIVEPNIYFVMIFETKKTEKDTYIANFMNEICTNLRCTKIFSSMKIQSK